MKKYIITLLLGLIFAFNTAFTPDTITTPPWGDEYPEYIVDTLPSPYNTVTRHTVEFTPATVNTTIKVEEENADLKVYLAQQAQTDSAFVEQIRELNSKIPDMTISPTEARLTALEEEFGITKDNALNSINTNTILTNSVNVLTFLLSLGLIGFLLNNGKVKRSPDAVVKAVYGFLGIAALFLLRFALLSLVSLINPTYQIIQQLG